MDKKIILRIDSLLKHINLIEEDVLGKTKDDFLENSLLTRATAFSVAQIGEQMVKMEESLKDEYPNLPWQSARGMRNFIIHDYDSVDVDQLYFTIVNDLPTLKISFSQIRNKL